MSSPRGSLDKRGNRRGGLYWMPGDPKPYISVTNVLKILDKPALQRWFGLEVYRAVIIDPSIDERTALAAPYNISRKAMDRGTTVHSIVEAHKNGATINLDGIPTQFQGYARAFYKFVDDFNPTILDNEKTLVSKKHGYAGTFDLRLTFGGDTFDPWVIDIKTGKDIYPESHLQLSAYFAALEEAGVAVKRRGVCLLGEDGTFKFEETPMLFDEFLAAKKLYEWRNKDMLTRYGYYG